MSQVLSLLPDHPCYPQKLQQHWDTHPLPTLSTIGNLQILQNQTLALFCSVQCPGDLILKTYDLARTLRDTNIVVISGFHSPMEKECLTLLLRGKQPILHCPARSLEKMRLLKEPKIAIDNGRLLFLSPFPAKQHRATAVLAQVRNQLVAALADAIFIAYATPGSKTETLARQTIAWDKPLLTFDSSDNQNLLNLGAQTINPVFETSLWTGLGHGKRLPPM